MKRTLYHNDTKTVDKMIVPDNRKDHSGIVLDARRSQDDGADCLGYH